MPGGVGFTASFAFVKRAHLWLRTPTRILLRLGRVQAHSFPLLQKKLATWPWARIWPKGRDAYLKVTADRCRLYHTGAIAERVGGILAAKVGAAYQTKAPAWFSDNGPDNATDPGQTEGQAQEQVAGDGPQMLLMRGRRDVWTISLDATGERLHKRGIRTEVGKAPLRENLAAGILRMTGWSPGQPEASPHLLVDPMCGSGSIVLEAAGWLLGRPPGAQRSFAFMSWPMVRQTDGAGLRDGADDQDAKTSSPKVDHSHKPGGTPGGTPNAVAVEGPETDPSIFASDQDPEAVARAQRNATQGGMENVINFSSARFANLKVPPLAPGQRGTVLTNPPMASGSTQPAVPNGCTAIWGQGWRNGSRAGTPVSWCRTDRCRR